MKIRIRETQYNILKQSLVEAKIDDTPVDLSRFFNNNKNAEYFSVVYDKTGKEWFFKLEQANGRMTIRDFNEASGTKNCVTDANFNNLVRGTTFKLDFKDCGPVTINDVVELRIYDNESAFKSKRPNDYFKLENEKNKDLDVFVKEYNNAIKSAKVGNTMHFDFTNQKGAKIQSWDGSVIDKEDSSIKVELNKKGKTTQPIMIRIDLTGKPFFEFKGKLMFKAKVVKGEKSETEFSEPISKFYLDRTTEKPETEDENKNEIEINQDNETELAKEMMDALKNDPNLKTAFYKAPTLLNRLLSAIKGKKPKGTGIVPAYDIISQYRFQRAVEKIGDNFNKFSFGKEVKYKFLSQTIQFQPETQNGNPVVFETNRTYVALASKPDISNPDVTLKDKKNDVEIHINEPYKKIKDSYDCTFMKGTESYNAIIKILSSPNSGYDDGNTKEEKPTTATSTTTNK